MYNKVMILDLVILQVGLSSYEIIQLELGHFRSFEIDNKTPEI